MVFPRLFEIRDKIMAFSFCSWWDAGFTLPNSFIMFSCQNLSDWVWRRDLKAILWEAAFPAPGKLLHKASAVRTCSQEPCGEGGQCRPPVFISKENSHDSKSEPAPQQGNVPFSFLSQLPFSPHDTASGEKGTRKSRWRMVQITFNIQGQVPTTYYLLSSVSLLSTAQYIKTQTLS